MDMRTRKALVASIAKWERNTRVEAPEEFLVTPNECPLCRVFFEDDCEGCPVMAATGKWACAGTPYEDASDAKDDWMFVHPAGDEEMGIAHAAAREEVLFLKSLVPAE